MAMSNVKRKRRGMLIDDRDMRLVTSFLRERTVADAVVRTPAAEFRDAFIAWAWDTHRATVGRKMFWAAVRSRHAHGKVGGRMVVDGVRLKRADELPEPDPLA
jgi:hypothetical protein